VLRLLAGGRTNKEIAADLVISVHTVERHLATIYRKIGARNRSDATALAHKSGLANT
jgi:DNA-binding NarL/FixJ family response regulator